MDSIATYQVAAGIAFPTPSVADANTSRPLACLRCRERRSGCSKERPQCSRCQKGRFECVYEETRKISINEPYLRELEAKAKGYDALVSDQAQSSPAAVPHWPQPPVYDDFEDDEDRLPLIEPFTHLSVSQPGCSPSSFIGPEASDTFLRSVRKLSGLHGDDGSLDRNVNFYDPEALRSRRGTIETRTRLPPIEIARRLFAAQYTYIGTIFFFTDPETFEKLLLEDCRGLPLSLDKETRLAHAKVLMILAFGQLYSINQWIDFHGPPGFEYFKAALELLPEPHEEGSILAVETLAYVGYFMQNMNRRDAAFVYIGMALRMAISLGLHQEVAGSGLDETTKEHRRRVWWSIYSLDRIVSVKSGNPLAIQDHDIGVAMPSRLASELEYCPAVVLRHYTELSRILGEVTSCIYRKTPKSGSRLMASVRNIMTCLTEWRRTLPEGLRFDPARLSISRESVSTFLHYYQCINMTARPLLFHVVQRRLRTNVTSGTKEEDWKTGLSQTTTRVIDMCVSAARDTINMMSIAAQLGLVATYGYMDGEHVFSAAIVLVMVCGAFPDTAQNTQAMHGGLHLLRGMAHRGNSHIGARHELLAHLKSILMPDRDQTGPPTPFSPPAQPGALTSSAGFPLDGYRAGTGTSAASNHDTAMLGYAPNTCGAEARSSSIFGINPSTDFPSLPYALHSTFPGVDTTLSSSSSAAADADLMLWEEGFADPVGRDVTQWMQATQSAIGGGRCVRTGMPHGDV
ncbi:Transcriptional activator [Coniothyrium glycines]